MSDPDKEHDERKVFLEVVSRFTLQFNIMDFENLEDAINSLMKKTDDIHENMFYSLGEYERFDDELLESAVFVEELDSKREHTVYRYVRLDKDAKYLNGK